jgi:hypothetical protein
MSAPLSLGSRIVLRIVALACGIVCVLLISACWITSITGLDEGGWDSVDHDRTFDPSLLGAWGVTSENCAVTMKITAKGDEYTLTETGKGKGCWKGKKKELYYRGILFKLDSHLFLDLSARPEDVCEMCRPKHEIYLMRIEKDAFSMTPIDSDWLKKAVEDKTVTMATLPGDTDTITASPKELKDFCRKYADNKEAFKPIPDFAFSRK